MNSTFGSRFHYGGLLRPYLIIRYGTPPGRITHISLGMQYSMSPKPIAITTSCSQTRCISVHCSPSFVVQRFRKDHPSLNSAGSSARRTVTSSRFSSKRCGWSPNILVIPSTFTWLVVSSPSLKRQSIKALLVSSDMLVAVTLMSFAIINPPSLSVSY